MAAVFPPSKIRQQLHLDNKIHFSLLTAEQLSNDFNLFDLKLDKFDSDRRAARRGEARSATISDESYWKWRSTRNRISEEFDKRFGIVGYDANGRAL